MNISRFRNWLIRRLGGVVPGPVEVRSLESNNWLNQYAPTFVIQDIQHLADIAASQHVQLGRLSEENQDLRRQLMHISHVSPDFSPDAA